MLPTAAESPGRSMAASLEGALPIGSRALLLGWRSVGEAGGKLRWRVWSEPEHVLVYSHQGPNAFTPALPAGRYTVGISITDPTISGGLKRTIVFAQKGDLVLPTPSPVVTGPGSLAPQTHDGP